MAGTSAEELLIQLKGLQESYRLYKDEMAAAEKAGDAEKAKAYKKALKGVRKGIEAWVESKFG